MKNIDMVNCNPSINHFGDPSMNYLGIEKRASRSQESSGN